MTAFLRFPPEIRIVIYRQLLLPRTTYEIQYHLCPVNKRLWLARRYNSTRPPFFRHGLFPAILRCCRRTYLEGRDVLYGENHFRIHRIRRPSSNVLNSWRLQQVYLESIAKVTEYSRKTVEMHNSLKPLTGLRELQISKTLSVDDFGAFLQQTASILKCIPKVVVQISVSDEETRKIVQSFKWTGTRLRDELYPAGESLCLAAYQPTLEKHRALWGGRTMKLRFYDLSGDYGPNWNFELSINDS